MYSITCIHVEKSLTGNSITSIENAETGAAILFNAPSPPYILLVNLV